MVTRMRELSIEMDGKSYTDALAILAREGYDCVPQEDFLNAATISDTLLYYMSTDEKGKPQAMRIDEALNGRLMTLAVSKHELHVIEKRGDADIAFSPRFQEYLKTKFAEEAEAMPEEKNIDTNITWYRRLLHSAVSLLVPVKKNDRPNGPFAPPEKR